MKYIFVTGGVVSSLGKGLTAASLGTLLENRGLKVALQKFDPYLNVDPGTMSPYQRSEEHTSELQSQSNLVCRLLLEKKKKYIAIVYMHDAFSISGWFLSVYHTLYT